MKRADLLVGLMASVVLLLVGPVLGSPVQLAHDGMARNPAIEIRAASSFSSRAGPPVAGPMMAYDAADGYLVAFGGNWFHTHRFSSATWTFSNGQWTQLTLATHPQARTNASMAYDPADHAVLLFGGIPAWGYSNLLRDTWLFHGGQWRELFPRVSPSARIGAGLVYDQRDGYMVLFGGARTDTWSFSHDQWTQIPTTSHPSARIWMGMAYDALDGYVVLFGGSDSAGFPVSDTWTYESGNWSHLNTTHKPHPGPRYWGGPSAMTYDASDRYVVLFSGTTDCACLPYP
jgi:hypothetical protein